jgi:hypothetical protein
MADQEKKTANASAARKKGKRPASAKSGELWARCPECRMPVKDDKLFKHLLNCPGAEVRQQEWAAEQARAKPEATPPAGVSAE